MSTKIMSLEEIEACEIGFPFIATADTPFVMEGLHFLPPFELNGVPVRVVREDGEGVFLSVQDVFRAAGLDLWVDAKIAKALAALGCDDVCQQPFACNPLDIEPDDDGSEIMYDLEPALRGDQAERLGRALIVLGADLVNEVRQLAPSVDDATQAGGTTAPVQEA